jgi:D-glycero-alpha-D-manno-heptose-7-phosphate kinase
MMMGIAGGIEVTSMADIPAGTGLGSSGSFTVGVLRALHSHLHQPVTNEELAALACHVEIDLLGERVGKQDQYATAIGGVTSFHFNADDSVSVEPVLMPADIVPTLEENLLLFYTGVRRSASEEIATQVDAADQARDLLDDNLKAVRELGFESCAALRAGDLDRFAGLLNTQWRLKYDRSPSSFHDQIDEWIREGLAAGACGGKLIGAGGGGFLLFYADVKSDLRRQMARLGLEEVRFSFDHEGSTTLVV